MPAKRKTRRTTKRTTATRKAKTRKTTTTKKKGAFGGYTICFKGCNDSVEKVFGSRPLPPSQMTKKLWTYVKSKRLTAR